jgi:hypothetical protein
MIKKICILISLVFFNCSNNKDEEINCALFDPVIPELYIRLIDENGANLFENRTFDPKNITIESDFPNPIFHFNSSNETSKPNIPEYYNTLTLAIPRESKFEYTINLNDTTTIILAFDAELVETFCGVSYYVPTGVLFNNQYIDLEREEADFIFLAEIKL